MNYLICDIESTCWTGKDSKDKNRNNSEVIELGFVLLDSTLKEISRFQSFICPTVRGLLSDFCKELTGIKQKDVDNAPFFPEAFNAMLDWVHAFKGPGEKLVLCSWGNYDKNQLGRDMARHAYQSKIEDTYYKFLNLKNYFAELTQTKPMGLSRAVKKLGLKFTGSHHRGIDDALNAAEILKRISINEEAMQKLWK